MKHDLHNSGLFAHVIEAVDTNINAQTPNFRNKVATGGGKTAIESHTLRLHPEGLAHEDFRVHVVLAPRIQLSNQLAKEYRNYIGYGYVALMLHSGKHEVDYERVSFNETATTRKDVVMQYVEQCKQLGKHLVIFSTYHSFHKVNELNLDMLGMLIADESQYCVSKEYFSEIVANTARSKQFYTATEKHVTTTNLGRGLNNETVFGPLLVEKNPQELIDKGIIVKPRMHVMKAKTTVNSKSTIIDEVIESALEQHKLTIKSGMPGSKILFSMSGTREIGEITKNISKIKAAMPDHIIFTIVSNQKYGTMIDGKKTIIVNEAGQQYENKISRKKFFSEISSCKNALVFHYDIISEGIDIDGFTGVVLKRNLNLSKLLQTIGRALRKYKANPALKPHAWVTVNVIDDDEENEAWVKDVLQRMRDGGYLIHDIEFTDNNTGGDDDDDPEDMIDPNSKKSLQSKIQDILHEIEDGQYWKEWSKLTILEKLAAIKPLTHQ
jgi:superfamily II DNA or RNA helicase